MYSIMQIYAGREAEYINLLYSGNRKLFLEYYFSHFDKKKIVDGKNSFNLTHSFFSHPLMKIIQFLRLAAGKIAFKTWHLPHIHLYISILDISIYNYKSMYLQMFMHSSGACSVYEC